MKDYNSDQYCGKYKCDYDNDFFDKKEMLQIQVFHLRSSPYYNDKDNHSTIQKFIDDNYIEDPYKNDNYLDYSNNPNNLD